MKVKFARTAINHIASIHDYIARDNPEAAKRAVAAIYRSTDRLAEFPASGRIGAKAETRELAVREYPYIMVNRALLDAIVVIAVFHAAQDEPRGGS